MAYFRIIKREQFCSDKIIAKYLVAQYKTWYWPFWRNINYFYKSDIEDMPGYFTYVCADVASAHIAIDRFKKKTHFSDSLVYGDIYSNK